MKRTSKRKAEQAKRQVYSNWKLARGWINFGIPLVRCSAPDLILNDLVSVQPLSGPMGYVTYMDFDARSTKHVAEPAHVPTGDDDEFALGE